MFSPCGLPEDPTRTFAHATQVQAVFKARVWGALKQLVVEEHCATRWREVMMASMNNEDPSGNWADPMPVRSLIQEVAFISGSRVEEVMVRLGRYLMENLLNEVDTMLLARLKVDVHADIARLVSRSELGIAQVTIVDHRHSASYPSLHILAVRLTDVDRNMHAAMFRSLGERLGIEMTVGPYLGSERQEGWNRFVVGW